MMLENICLTHHWSPAPQCQASTDLPLFGISNSEKYFSILFYMMGLTLLCDYSEVHTILCSLLAQCYSVQSDTYSYCICSQKVWFLVAQSYKTSVGWKNCHLDDWLRRERLEQLWSWACPLWNCGIQAMHLPNPSPQLAALSQGVWSVCVCVC